MTSGCLNFVVLQSRLGLTVASQCSRRQATARKEARTWQLYPTRSCEPMPSYVYTDPTPVLQNGASSTSDRATTTLEKGHEGAFMFRTDQIMHVHRPS